MAIYEVSNKRPELGDGIYVHEQASVIGEVALGEQTSVWPQAVVCGDSEAVTLGLGCSIQAGAVVQATPGFPVVLADRVTIESLASLHGCTLGEGCFVGERAVISNGAEIGAHSWVAAGALVKEGDRFPANALIEGSPAKAVRTLSEQELTHLAEINHHYLVKAESYRTSEKLITRGKEQPLYYSIL